MNLLTHLLNVLACLHPHMLGVFARLGVCFKDHVTANLAFFREWDRVTFFNLGATGVGREVDDISRIIELTKESEVLLPYLDVSNTIKQKTNIITYYKCKQGIKDRREGHLLNLRVKLRKKMQSLLHLRELYKLWLYWLLVRMMMPHEST